MGEGFELGEELLAMEEEKNKIPIMPEEKAEEKDPWPILAEEGYYGLVGEIVRTIEPHTEADPVALLVSLLAEFGVMIGRDPHLILDGSRHPLLIYPVLVGTSSKSRKGSAGKRIKSIFEAVDPTWTRGRYKGNLSSVVYPTLLYIWRLLPKCVPLRRSTRTPEGSDCDCPGTL